MQASPVQKAETKQAKVMHADGKHFSLCARTQSCSHVKEREPAHQRIVPAVMPEVAARGKVSTAVAHLS